MEAALHSGLHQRLVAEEAESTKTLHLTANENVLSRTARIHLEGSLYGRYHLGHPDKRAIKGYGSSFLGLQLKSLPATHEMEKEACRVTAKLFGATYSDFRPLSGVHAIIVSLVALTSIEDNVYCLKPTDAGHFATADILRRLGRNPRYLPWDNEAADLDLDRVQELFMNVPPRCIYLDHSTSLFPLRNLRNLRDIVPTEVPIIYDASHPLGLIAGGAFANPLLLGADVLQGSTHKSFPGPQKGLILTNSQRAAERLETTMNSFVSSQHSGDTLALYTTMLEMEEYGKTYAAQIILNSQALGSSLASLGFQVFAPDKGATCSHQLVLVGFGVDENVLSAQKLLSCGISVNSKTSLGKPVIRLGVQEQTRRGMKGPEMEQIAVFFRRALKDAEEPGRLRAEVSAFVAHYQDVHYSFDIDSVEAA